LKTNSIRQRLLASSMICGATFLMAGQASAAAAAATSTAPNTVTEIVVTGTRIAQPNLTSNSPLVTVGQEDVKAAGVATIDTLTNALPQVIGGQNLGQSINANGIATVDLRGLGPVRTLVLVNGRRLQPGDPQSVPNLPVPDLNTIPAALVDRVDVVTGGASAVYGADAVAGVVNFIMVHNYQGVRFDAQYSFDQHNQQDSLVQNALRAGNYKVPGSVTDGGQTSFSAVMGTNFAEDKGNITVYATYFNSKPVTQATRDFAACGLYATQSPASVNSAYDSYKCFGSSNGAYGKFKFLTNPGITTPPVTNKNFADSPDGSSNFVPSQGSFGYNFNTLSYLQRQDDRYTAGYFAHYDMDPKLNLYSEFMFLSDHSTAQYAPSGLFSGSGAVVGQSYFEVNCNNPFLSTQQATALCGAAAGTAVNGRMLAGYRFAAVPRTDAYTHESYRINFGLKGDLGEGWNYDAYVQYGTALYEDTQGGYTSLAKIQKALLVDPATGKCYSGGDCVPLNLFRALGAGISQAAYNYVLTPGLRNGRTTEQIASASITGDLGQYGVKSGWAKDGLGVAGGAEYRRETLAYNVDNEYTIGDLSGGSQSKSNSGSFDVYELFGEARLPLIQDMPWVKSLSITTGYRLSDYSTGTQTDTYKGEAEYSPTEDIRFRYSYNHAVRAPNVNDLFTPQVQNLFNGQDPCAGAVTVGSTKYTQCLRTGATAGQLGSIDQCPASQCGSLSGGNTALKPESADTYTYGFVVTPHWVPGLNFSVDYWNIRVQDIIVAGLGGPAVTLGNCLSTGSPVFCSAVHRDVTTGDLFGSGFVDARNTNSGFLQTKGIDFAVNYRTQFSDWSLPEWGGLAFNMVGTYTDHYVTQPITGGGTYECAGLFGATCGTPDPHWRHRAKLTWTTPWSVNATLTWRYIGASKFDGNQSNQFLNNQLPVDLIDGKFKAISYIDLSASWKVKTGLTLRGGVNNLFDQDPPRGASVNVGATGTGNGNMFPQIYDTLGRNIFMSVSAEF
jgi:iron complex outermembrane receptor protein